MDSSAEALSIGEGKTFRKDAKFPYTVYLFLVVGALLILPSLVSIFSIYAFEVAEQFEGAMQILPGLVKIFSTLSGREAGGTGGLFANFCGAVIGLTFLMVFFTLQSQAKIAKNLVLTVDQTGLAEEGYPKPEQNWKCAWSDITQAKVAVIGSQRILHIFTAKDEKKPTYVLGGYPTDELVGLVNTGLAPIEKSVR